MITQLLMELTDSTFVAPGLSLGALGETSGTGCCERASAGEKAIRQAASVARQGEITDVHLIHQRRKRVRSRNG